MAAAVPVSGQIFDIGGNIAAPTTSSGTVTSQSTFDPSRPSTQDPTYMIVDPDPNHPNDVYTINANISGTLVYSSPITQEDFANNEGSLINIQSGVGPVTLDESGPESSIQINWTTSLVPTNPYQLGVAAIEVKGKPQSDGTGSAVTVYLNQGSTINVTLPSSSATPFTNTPLLSPDGIRTASLNGIMAVSFGAQSGSTTLPGGAVDVQTSADTVINMSSADPTVLTAGISAASAVGVGDTDGSTSDDRTVTVDQAGSIINSAGSGAGIFATTTGAQFPSGSTNVAFGGPVNVTLESTGSLLLTGTTGVGIFAASEAYPTSHAPKNSTVQGGTVTITLDQGSTITTGTGTSTLSIGVLASSAGTDALINPFSTQPVNETGSGSGGQVSVSSSGTISTAGSMSIGIAAVSVGGAGIATIASSDSNNAYAYLGGGDSSTADGSGAQVTVNNNSGASIITVGNSAYGIVAISSGGGGLIDNLIDATYDSEGKATGGLIIGNGTTQSGDQGHGAGAVTVTNDGYIQTGDGNGNGAASIGIVAQSIGGNGGSAGGKAALFVGDNGGGGGDGSTVNVTNGVSSTVLTEDVNSIGILAQSVGGGGGNGGNAEGLFVAVGGRGGEGGSGSTVTLDLSGSIITLADHSAGVIGQSIGGGGGNGGGATSIGLFDSAAIGGEGGGGGDGGTTTGTLEMTSNIQTQGNNSAGMILQSIGGGGGTGGAAYSGNEGLLVGITVALGGNGGISGTGGVVSATNYGTITTGVAKPTSGFVSAPTVAGDDSDGIIAQSIGGGGGHAGSAVADSVTLAVPDTGALNLNLSLGGTGGAAGNGGNVTATNQGSITTYGDGSIGIFSESVGGGGGDGGDSTATSVFIAPDTASVGANLTFGGGAGSGGDGGNVTALNSTTAASIFTQGQNAAGILAQSIGGGGGNGGFGNGKTDTPTLGTESSSYVLTLAMGAQGGKGGNSGYLFVENDGSIITQGSGSQGILAQTIGGGGGNSGGGLSSASNNNVTLNISIGANGANGGNASQSQTYVQNSGLIETSGGDGTGILAQAIGGGGGNGGSSDATASIGVWGNLTGLFANSAKYQSNISVGGKGGAGGLGGSLFVGNIAGTDETQAQIITTGERAYGMVAQSIGGGGGVGGGATALSNSTFLSPLNRNANYEATLALGGSGGAGSDGGLVVAVNSGVISTSGYGSHAMVAQSIGGGGGIAADGSVDIHANLGLGIDINEAAGSASSGGTITLMQNGKLETSGIDATGVLAQSIGGGGGLGTAGSFFSGKVNGSGYTSIGLNATLGFNLSNSTPSNGGTITITNGPDIADGNDPLGGVIVTTGDWSSGIVAQSVGAGGGKSSSIYGTASNYYPDLAVSLGGTAGTGNGGTVTGSLTGGSITTSGYSAFGYVAQSIGGGGGMFSDASSISTGSITLGGTAGVSGDGGAVILNTSGNGTAITTHGYGAHGIILQSIGGGGGIAGTGNSSLTQSATGAAVNVGGSNSSGNGSTIAVNNAAINVTTTGDNAYGLVAQSIGGGGGIATALNGTAPGNSTATGNPSSLGASNATTDSNGGDINMTIASGSQISTSGLGSYGLVIQTIGGGGGIANSDISGSDGGLTTSGALNDNKAMGYGGNVTATVDANITTAGNGAYGVIVQSIGGGGGIFGNFAGSTGSTDFSSDSASNGTINYTQNGDVSATGINSTGIFVQNRTAGSTGNIITVNVNGSVTGGSGTGAGIWIDGGAIGNALTISSSSTVSAASGLAILYTASTSGTTAIAVINKGQVNGSINLSQYGAMNNKGTFNSGAEVTGFVVNNGILNPGGKGAGQTTVFNSQLQSLDSSTLQFDIYSATNYDSLTFNPGANAQVYGAIEADFHDLANGDYTFTLIDSGNGSSNVFPDDWNNLQVTGLDPGSTTSWSFGTNDSFILQVEAVPEPDSAMLVLGGSLVLAILLAYRKREELT